MGNAHSAKTPPERGPTVALANKTVRIAWIMLRHGIDCEPEWNMRLYVRNWWEITL